MTTPIYSKIARGTGIDLRSAGPSGPVKTYKPGEVQWFTQGRGNKPMAAIVSVLGGDKGLGLSKIVSEWLQEMAGTPEGERTALAVGYLGAERWLVIQPQADGPFRVNLFSSRSHHSNIGGGWLAGLLCEHGIRPGRYPARRGEGRVLVDLSVGVGQS